MADNESVVDALLFFSFAPIHRCVMGLAPTPLISRVTRLMFPAVVLRGSLYTLMAFLIILCYVCFLNDLIDTIASVRNPSCLFLFCLFSLFPFYWFCPFAARSRQKCASLSSLFICYLFLVLLRC
jgi:hypothetical protein